jgi:hypothetical protein
MYVDGEMEAVESKRAALRHAPVERLFDAGPDGEGPRRAVERTNPHESPLTLPLPSRGEGFSETV